MTPLDTQQSMAHFLQASKEYFTTDHHGGVMDHYNGMRNSNVSFSSNVDNLRSSDKVPEHALSSGKKRSNRESNATKKSY